MRTASDSINELGKLGQANGLMILAMRTVKHCPAGESEQPFSRDGHERPAARKASALNPGHLEQVADLVSLAVDFHQIELSGVGHGPSR